MNVKATNLIWIDLEMTGLNPDHDRILEIAIVVTDNQLNILAEAPVFAIHQDDTVLANMDEWCTNQHGKSGLIERVKQSQITVEQAEAEMLKFLQNYVPAKKSPMCGNSICQDRRFLFRWMPKLEQYFQYRNLDVSSIKVLALHWAPEIYQAVKKESRHLALDDIRESIDELKYYREHFFKLPIVE